MLLLLLSLMMDKKKQTCVSVDELCVSRKSACTRTEWSRSYDGKPRACMREKRCASAICRPCVAVKSGEWMALPPREHSDLRDTVHTK